MYSVQKGIVLAEKWMPGGKGKGGGGGGGGWGPDAPRWDGMERGGNERRRQGPAENGVPWERSSLMPGALQRRLFNWPQLQHAWVACVSMQHSWALSRALSHITMWHCPYDRCVWAFTCTLIHRHDVRVHACIIIIIIIMPSHSEIL